jgi:hypothetical protein
MEAKLKQALGEQVFALIALQSQNEELQKKIEELTAQLEKLRGDRKLKPVSSEVK